MICDHLLSSIINVRIQDVEETCILTFKYIQLQQRQCHHLIRFCQQESLV